MAATIDRSTAASMESRFGNRPLPRDPETRPAGLLGAAYDRDEDGEPVYRVVKEKIKAASTTEVLALARKLLWRKP